LSGPGLRGARLRGVELEDVVYDATTVWPAGFDPAAAKR
jgi:hypothetical protein